MAANHFDFRIKLMNSRQKTGIYMKKTKMYEDQLNEKQFGQMDK